MNTQQEHANLIGDTKFRGVFDQQKSRCCSGKTALMLLFGTLLSVAVATGFIITFILASEIETISNICHDPCMLTLVESIPENLTYPDQTIHTPTDKALMELINSAEQSIEVVAFYWTLQSKDMPFQDNSSLEGQLLFDTLLKIGRDTKVKIKIVQNPPSRLYPQLDSKYLQEHGNADVRNLNVSRLMGAGIVHTKLWLIDRKHFYVGSANCDWRSLTQVKELGIMVQNCSCLASDMGSIFDVYWYLAGGHHGFPVPWPDSFITMINATTPENVTYNNHSQAMVYLASSPPPFCPPGRSVDIDAIVSVIRAAKRFVYVAVMDYLPMIAYVHPRKFWSIIDDELRRAAVDRGINVRLLGSRWNHTDPDMPVFLKSLLDIDMLTRPHVNIQVKMFEVPIYTPEQAKIPYGRVNHNKYMVTDQHAYIGTSNWYGDYFVNTAGIGFVLQSVPTSVNSMDIRMQLENVFIRDWTSNYSHPLIEHEAPPIKQEL